MDDFAEWTEPPDVDVSVPSTARIYHDLLDGKSTFEADRGVADRLREIAGDDPGLAARENRGFLQRATAMLAAELGITQFLDVGAGLPVARSVSDIAFGADESARVAYVDHDPVVVRHLQALVADKDGIAVAQADLRQPGAVLTHTKVRDLLDFSRPAAVVLGAVLHFLSDEDAYPAVRYLVDALAPGSYVVVSHATADGAQPGEAEQVTQAYTDASEPLYLRPLADVRRFLDGLEAVPPGTVPVGDWRPDPGHPSKAARVILYGAVARKAKAS